MRNKFKRFNLDPKLQALLKQSGKENNWEKIFKHINYLKKNSSMLYALNQIKLLELSQNLRKPKIAIYDHAFHFIGGAQKYGLTMASALQESFDLTIIVSKPVELKDLSRWYNLDLSGCSLKLIRLDFFDRQDAVHIDPSLITKNLNNPFAAISRESAQYDIFINNSMLEMVYSLAAYSVMICHFPERRPASYFYSDLYDQVVYNSKYTKYWIEKRWNFEPHTHLYPPVDMQVFSPGKSKDNLIISVARFELEGTKKQLEMIKAFNALCSSNPELLNSWSLVLIGGSTQNNPYLDSIKQYIKNKNISKCKIAVNVSDKELKHYYSHARIFWHLCGLGQTDPAKVEHFGMTIAEAMQNRLVPLVFDGGGQREIVEHNHNGFRVSSTVELIHYTKLLIASPDTFENLAENAFNRSKDFSREQFVIKIRSIFAGILKTLAGQVYT
jgi:glycosyltransferase involved in cell wall biosynthesis